MTESMEECGCSEEYGPCEQHCEVIVQRDGAAVRTSDELNLQYITDALNIDSQCLTPYGTEIRRKVVADLATMHEFGWSNWISDPALADELRDLVTQVESYLAPLQTYWDDGYRIVRITGGPFAELED